MRHGLPSVFAARRVDLSTQVEIPKQLSKLEVNVTVTETPKSNQFYDWPLYSYGRQTTRDTSPKLMICNLPYRSTFPTQNRFLVFLLANTISLTKSVNFELHYTVLRLAAELPALPDSMWRKGDAGAVSRLGYRGQTGGTKERGKERESGKGRCLKRMDATAVSYI